MLVKTTYNKWTHDSPGYFINQNLSFGQITVFYEIGHISDIQQVNTPPPQPKLATPAISKRPRDRDTPGVPIVVNHSLSNA